VNLNSQNFNPNPIPIHNPIIDPKPNPNYIPNPVLTSNWNSAN